MGLTVSTGILADQFDGDPEGAEWIREELHAVNRLLGARLGTTHDEPETGHTQSWDCYGYSALHALRDLAGRVWQGVAIGREPLSGEQSPHGDALFAAALAIYDAAPKPSLFGRLFGSRPTQPAPPAFLHLSLHSDSAGYYVPIDFPIPLVPKVIETETAHLWPLGSVQRLQCEVQQLCDILEIPSTLTADSDAIQYAIEANNAAANAPLWQAQPLASHSALVLREACTAALASGTAIHFG